MQTADIEVSYLGGYGTDLTIINAAKVSFAQKTEEMGNDGVRLINFLASGMTKKARETLFQRLVDCSSLEEAEEIYKEIRGISTHFSPFTHAFLSFHVKAPLFVARQLAKSTVGLAWNEVSRRYVDDEPSFYVPEVWRKRADNVKQGSSDDAVDLSDYSGNGVFDDLDHQVSSTAELALNTYQEMLNAGICPEQARMVLPQSMNTIWHWSGSLYAFARVCKLRLDSHAQKETRVVAEEIAKLTAPLFPVSWPALMNERN